MVVSELTASATAMGPMPIDGGGGSGVSETLPTLVNRASESKSSFIRSNAESFVAWQLLDQATVDRAKKENKLIFMHIGFKACHFCRLMALESFSNMECAALLNDSFIPVIVDREQRPDLDTIYMNYVQAVSNSGGWPLNLFLTPDLEPIFGGTYWPGPYSTKPSTGENEDEVLDFLMIIKKVLDIWSAQEARCRKEAAEVLGQLREFAAEGTLGTRAITAPQAMASTGLPTPAVPESTPQKKETGAVSSELDLDQLEEAYTYIAGTFDPVFGGFGLAPKFPTPPKLAFLLQLKQLPSVVQDVVGEAEVNHATQIALDTLRKIRDGALHDHVGGTGFSRCSVTPDWSIPNFEKLVVDNALLLSLYLEAWRISGGQKDSEFYDVVVELVDYLSSPPIVQASGGIASSEAADSYGKKGDKEMREGAYYTWTRREFDTVVGATDKHVSQLVAAHWGILEDGNVDQDHDPNDDFINQNILRVVKGREDLSKQFSIPVEQVERYIQQAKADLKARRDRERVRPELDDKIITSWNGLVISALSRASVALKSVNEELSAKCLLTAKGAAAFVFDNLYDQENKVLYRIWKDGRETDGFADDYANYIQGLLDLFDAEGDENVLKSADTLTKAQIARFYDPAGAFYTSTASAPHTILRLKDGMDTSLPSTNAVSVANLFRLSALLDDARYADIARATVNAFEAEMLQHPWLYPGLLAGVVTARLGVQGTPVVVSFKATREKA